LVLIIVFAALPLVFVLLFFMLKFLPEVMVFVDKHLKLSLNFLMILIDIIVVGELLNRLRQFCIDLDQLFQRLLQHGVFLLELIHLFP
jgi:hypothetical protein